MIKKIARAIEHQNNCLQVYCRLYSIMPKTLAMAIAQNWERTLIYRGMNRFLNYLATKREANGSHRTTNASQKLPESG